MPHQQPLKSAIISMQHPRQKHILCTWEIGNDLGHLTRLANITRKLEQKNYRVTLAIKDLSRAALTFQDTKADILQAPIWIPQIKLNRPIACIADTLLLLGYLNPDGLQGLVWGWRGLIETTKPDLILYDYSPTALLASHNISAPKVIVGTGFPDPAPHHAIADWRPLTYKDQLIERQENRLLESINTVLARESRPSIARFSDLYHVDHTIITTFPALDLYQDVRQNAHYRPFNENTAQRPPVIFPTGTGPKIIAYLKPQYPHLDILLKALTQCDGRVFVACPGGQEHQFKPYASDRFHYSTQIVALEQGIAEADLFVGHGNMSSVTQGLQFGTPMVTIPIHLEQLLTGKKLHSMGMGILIEKIDSAEQLRAKLNAALTSTELTEHARRFQHDNSIHLQEDLAVAVANYCDELLTSDSKR